ncbi:MAG: flagellar basal body-associated FliL family protein [Spirochaetes bacterium]|jgi:flagellar FliL protein|nr:flagellar basal body-associated FliL family protein [Spirochaetota bacterium]
MGDEEREDIVEEEKEQAVAEPPSTSGLSRIIKILLYVAGGIMLIVIVTGISYLVAKHVQERGYEKSQDIVAAPPPPPLTSFDLTPAFTNTTSDPEPHFVKVDISLGYEQDVELNNELVKRKDQMRHIINIILKGKKFDDLNSVSDAVALAEEIKAHINVVLISGKIKEVYFKEFVVN